MEYQAVFNITFTCDVQAIKLITAELDIVQYTRCDGAWLYGPIQSDIVHVPVTTIQSEKEKPETSPEAL